MSENDEMTYHEEAESLYRDEWFCNNCSVYFPAVNEEDDQCPTCGAYIDPVSGVAR